MGIESVEGILTANENYNLIFNAYIFFYIICDFNIGTNYVFKHYVLNLGEIYIYSHKAKLQWYRHVYLLIVVKCLITQEYSS